ncbi:outer membrane lipoprotein carrier protein LolA [Paenibacillus sp. OAS669]|uniref:outer membrane lipoprotein carrier protein LolA n=1 Tax=Paenibacillus sp. OAS669 TaxID=2663821 RepID=UPI00178B8A78|nr:outer membrane lipoprotein carrier protein LolA [Paenibacillus sp. OAS669]MBE1445659.1 outer membrane lipoprotein-sorting protein [Paenibacillus sp. OAS669]
MRRFTWVIALVLSLSLVLAGCGKKDSGSVVKDLDSVMNKLQSYQGSGRMVLHTGQEPQEYQVEVWFQNPHYYRISLTNAKKDITQIVLRNDDGVFVLTPHLNKSFRFQSDWPENQGQVYLYQSLIQSILMDNERHFTTDQNAYVFDVLANYQNGSLARQKIWLDKKNYAPQHVEVSDANANVMMIVDFNQFEFGKKFDKDSFDMQRNMTSWNIMSLPTSGQPGTHDAGTIDGKADSKGAATDKATGTTSGATSSSGTSTNSGSTASNGATGAKAGSAVGTNVASSDAAKGTTAGTSSNGNAGATAPADKATSGAASGTATKGAANGTGAANPTNGTTNPPSGSSSAASGTGANGAATGAAAGTTGTAAGTKGDTSKQGLSFGVIEPHYVPNGVKKQDVKMIKLGDEDAVMLRYSGKYNYTLVESRPETQTVTSLPGNIVDLGFTLAVVIGDEKKTMTWTYEGVEFRLSTADLHQTEMIKVAQAVQDEMGK